MDTVFLTSIFIAFFIAMIGWGQLLIGRVNLARMPSHLFLTAWCGFAIAIIFVEVLHFVSSITWKLSALFAILGWCNYVRNWRGFNYSSFKLKLNATSVLIGIILLAWAYLAVYKIMFPSSHYDVDLYYTQTIKWFNEFPITWGLGNLHSRLGFNQSFFSFAALLNLYPLWGHGLAASNLFILFVTVGTVGFLYRDYFSAMPMVALLVVLTCFSWLFSPESPGPDATIAYLQLSIFLVLLALFTLDNKDSQNRTTQLCSLLVLLSTLSLVIKLSSAIFVVFSLLISIKKLIAWFRSDHKLAMRLISLCFVLLVAHFCRGYALTGYPLYPSTFLGAADAPWSLPLDAAHNEIQWIYASARQGGKLPSEVLGNWTWVASWLAALPLKVWVIATLCGTLTLLFILMICFTHQSIRTVHRRAFNAFYLYLPLVLGVLAWFLTAPNIRFLGLIPELILVLTAFLFCAYLSETAFWTKRKKVINYVCTLLSICWVATFFLNLQFEKDLLIFLGVARFYAGLSQPEIDWLVESFNWNLLNIALFFLFFIATRATQRKWLGFSVAKVAFQVLLTVAIINHLTLSMGFWWGEQKGWRPVAHTAYTSQTAFDLTINVPARGDQCGDAPLPCAPGPNTRLRELSRLFNLLVLKYHLVFYGSK